MLKKIFSSKWTYYIILTIIILTVVAFLIPSISYNKTVSKQLADEQQKNIKLNSTISTQSKTIATLQQTIKQKEHVVDTKPNGEVIVTDLNTDTDTSASTTTIAQMKASFDETIAEKDKEIENLKSASTLDINKRTWAAGLSGGRNFDENAYVWGPEALFNIYGPFMTGGEYLRSTVGTRTTNTFLIKAMITH